MICEKHVITLLNVTIRAARCWKKQTLQCCCFSCEVIGILKNIGKDDLALFGENQYRRIGAFCRGLHLHRNYIILDRFHL